MPTYHYRCSSCEQHLEVVQSMTDDPITDCAACEGTMQKVLQPVGIVLKGSGFYRTDSRSKAKGTSDSSPAKDSGSGKEPSSKKESSSKSSDGSSSPSSSSPSSGSSAGSSDKASAAKSA